MSAGIDADRIVREATERAFRNGNGADQASFADPERQASPDLSVLKLHRRPPPPLPLEVFGKAWAEWIRDAAQASAAPPDYVAAPLLASASVLIGNARWAQAAPSWAEPAHLWCAVVGDSGSSKSPGADALMGHVLPAIEQHMTGDFSDRLREWQAQREVHEAGIEIWKKDVRAAQKKGASPPLPPGDVGPEPQMPRLRQNDVTIEKVAALLAYAAPKGLLAQRPPNRARRAHRMVAGHELV